MAAISQQRCGKDTAVNERKLPRWLQPVTEYGPLLVFFAVYLTRGLLPATGALLAATAVGLVLSLIFLRRLPWLAVVAAAGVGIFGGLTLWLHDDSFIKMKPTVVNGIFAVILLGGLMVNRLPLRAVLGKSITISEAGWRVLTLRWGLFFILLAVLNEAVWRTQTEAFWVGFKVFGLIGLTVVFAVAQTPLIRRYWTGP
jgi:intracellular septation protein